MFHLYPASYRGHNCAFGVSISFNFTSSHCMALATCTSLLCPALPLLPPLQFESGSKVTEDGNTLRLLDQLSRTSQEMHAINTEVAKQVRRVTNDGEPAVIA